MNSSPPQLIRPAGTTRRGPRPRSWYEASVRHALRNYANPQALRRNRLIQLPALAALADTHFSETWDPCLAALRYAIRRSVEDVLVSSDELDRPRMEIVLRGVLRGRTIAAIASDLSYSREWLHRTWWPQSVQAVTDVLLRSYLRDAKQDSASQLSA